MLDRARAAALLLAFVAALQFSIAAAQHSCVLAARRLGGHARARQTRPTAPRFFWPLLPTPAVTLVSAAFSLDPDASLIDSKQLSAF